MARREPADGLAAAANPRLVMLVLTGVLLALLCGGVSVYLALGATSAAVFLIEGHGLAGLAQLVMDRLNSGTLISVPFFVIAATALQRSGAAAALIDAAEAWVGRLTGGIALVCVFAATLFSAISGSSTATALALGALLIPAMRARSYPEGLAAGVIGSSATLGLIIPPSLALIIFGVVAGESVPRLFLAGVVPGLMLSALFMIWILCYCRTLNLPAESPRRAKDFMRLQGRALPAAAIPAVALGGIYGGVLTVTEAAAAAAALALALARWVYNDGTVDWLEILGESTQRAAAILFIVAFAFPFAHLVIVSGAPEALVSLVKELDLGPVAFMAALSLVMLALGMVLEVVSVMLITLPIVLPILAALDINPVHYAIVVIVNMGIATLTPPVGLSLFVLASLSKASLPELLKGVAPFLLLMAILLGLVIAFPQLALWLPDFIYGAADAPGPPPKETT